MKKVLTVVMILIVAGSIFAGGRQSGAAQDGPVTLAMWNWDENVTDVTIPAFERSHPNIRIERVPVTAWDMPLKVQQSLAAGLDMPDILLAEFNQRAQMFSMDIWENLELPPYNVRREVFFESTVGLMQNSRGEIIAIDQTLCPTGMAFKKGPARQWLGTDDRAALDNMFRSLDDFVSRGAEVSRASGGRVFMFSSPHGVLDWTRRASTVRLVDANGTINFTGVMSNPLDFLIKLRDANAVDVFGIWSPQNSATYAADNHIFYPTPNWGIQFMIKANDPNGQGRWGLMLPPGGGYSWGGTVQGIYKGSRHKAEVWEYLRWFSFTREGVEVVKRGTDYFTPVREFYNDPNYVSNVDPFFDGIDTGNFFYLDLMPNMVPPSFTLYDNIMEETSNALADFIMANRNVNLQQALARGIEELRSRVNVPVR